MAALALVSTAEPARRASPTTVRGIRLGLPIAKVVERYGPPGDNRLWYASDGIAFNIEGPADTVQSILVMPRGTTPPASP